MLTDEPEPGGGNTPNRPEKGPVIPFRGTKLKAPSLARGSWALEAFVGVQCRSQGRWRASALGSATRIQRQINYIP